VRHHHLEGTHGCGQLRRTVPSVEASGGRLPPEYKVNYSTLTKADVQTIRRLQRVDFAKKRVPCICLNGLLDISKEAWGMPPAATAKPQHKYLGRGTKYYGAGMPFSSACSLVRLAEIIHR
jgi:hypothetical protein